MRYDLRTLSPDGRAKLAGAGLGAVVLAMAIAAIVSGGSRWGVVLPRMRSRMAHELKSLDETVKRRDRQIEEIQSDRLD